MAGQSSGWLFQFSKINATNYNKKNLNFLKILNLGKQGAELNKTSFKIKKFFLTSILKISFQHKKGVLLLNEKVFKKNS